VVSCLKALYVRIECEFHGYTFVQAFVFGRQDIAGLTHSPNNLVAQGVSQQ
jgi:hypothetical protein